MEPVTDEVKVYYSHSMVKYGSESERNEIEHIRRIFPNARIINPNGGFIITCMEDCYREIMKCNIFVFTSIGPFVGKGVFEEIYRAFQIGIPIRYLHEGEFYGHVRLDVYDGNDWKVKYSRVEIIAPEESEDGL